MISYHEKDREVRSSQRRVEIDQSNAFRDACIAVQPTIEADLQSILDYFVQADIKCNRVILKGPDRRIDRFKFQVVVTINFFEDRNTQFVIELRPKGNATLLKEKARKRWLLPDIVHVPYQHHLGDMMFRAQTEVFVGSEWVDIHGPDLAHTDCIFTHIYLES